MEEIVELHPPPPHLPPLIPNPQPFYPQYSKLTSNKRRKCVQV